MSKYIIASIGKNTPSILGLKLKHADNEKPLTYLPGQYATISYTKKGRKSAVRCFSICSSPTNLDEIEFGIRLGGKFTKALENLHVGDTVYIDGPYGNFIFDPNIHKNLVLCAGGIGITPFMSMVRYASKLQLQNRISLIVSSRNKNEIPYFDELQSLSSSNKNLHISYVIDNADILSSNVSGKVYSGRINNQILIDSSSKMHNPTYFLCGPPPFMKGVTSMLVQNGINSERIITEAFAQGQVFKYGDNRDWPSTVYLAGVFGTLIAGSVVIANEMIKSISPTILPYKLTSEQRQTSVGRQKDLDAAVNELNAIIIESNKSPRLIAAEKEVSEAEAKIAEVNAINNNTSYSPTSSASNSSSNSTTTSNVNSQPNPQPVATTPVCTTSASGVTVCQ